jgi:Domain of unknown function (DUF5618)
MSIQEQSVHYLEALRYMDNAKETLQKAKKEDKFYQDAKYVKTACGTAYNGVLIAVETWLKIKSGNKFKRPRSIESFRELVGKQDKKLLNVLNSAYDILHLSGYYDGIRNANVIKEGFDNAYEIIDYIKPNSLN